MTNECFLICLFIYIHLKKNNFTYQKLINNKASSKMSNIYSYPERMDQSSFLKNISVSLKNKSNIFAYIYYVLLPNYMYHEKYYRTGEINY